MAKRNSAGLTEKQQSVLDFMRKFHGENDQLPPMSSIREAFGWAANNSAAEVCKTLEVRGHLQRNAVGKYKFTRQIAKVAAV